MAFSVNHPFLYLVAGIVVVFVIAQSGFFLVKAIRQARKLNIKGATIRKTVFASALFSVAPAVSILVGVITLSKFIGLPYPWLRLSVLGAVTYELPAATLAASAMNAPVTQTITHAPTFAAIAWVMALGILSGLVLVLLGLRKIQSGMVSLAGRDKRWGQILSDALFLGMISAFVGLLFSRVREGLPGFVPLVVALASALLMAACGLLIRRFKWTWLEQYALPLSMLGAMALSLPITALMAPGGV